MRDTRPDYPPEYDEPDASDYPHTVQSLADDLGLGATLGQASRAYDRHGLVTLGVRVPHSDPAWHYGREAIDKLTPETPIDRISISGIAWDASDWEYGVEGEPTREGVQAADAAFAEALAEYEAQRDAEDES